MNLLDRTTLRILFTALTTAALLASIWLARKPLLVFLFAMLFAYLLDPLIALLQRRFHCGRGVAIAVTYLAIMAVLVTVGGALGPRVVEEVQHLSASLPGLYNKLASGSIAFQVGRAHGWSEDTQARAQQFIVEHRAEFLSALSAQSTKAAEVAGNAFWLVLIPILAVFFLKDKSQFAQNIENLLKDQNHRRLLRGIMHDLDDMLAHFVRAQLYLAGISALVYVAALTPLHVPYSLALGIIGGLLEFIPFVGPLVAGALIMAVCIGMNFSLMHLLVVLAFLLVWRVLQDYLVSPRILGGRVEVHPLAAIFGVLAGGEIAGVAGVYFSLPVMAAARILWKQWRQHTQPQENHPEDHSESVVATK